MKEVVLANVGSMRDNVNGGEYVAKPQIVSSGGLITTPESAVKLYTIASEREELPREYILALEAFTQGRVTRDDYKQSGLGFAIISDRGILNIGMWGGSSPSFLNSSSYTVDREIQGKIIQQDMNCFPTFSVWELSGVVAHEAKAWSRFLRSHRTDSDKQEYLDDFFKEESNSSH